MTTHSYLMIRNIFTKKTIIEIFRFAIVGAIATVIHYAIYYFLQKFININIAYTIGYATSFICNFFLTAVFTFRSSPTASKGLGFGISHIINYLLQIGFLNLFIIVGVDVKFAPFPVYAISIPINFLMVRWVFKKI